MAIHPNYQAVGVAATIIIAAGGWLLSNFGNYVSIREHVEYKETVRRDIERNREETHELRGDLDHLRSNIEELQRQVDKKSQ